jgi:hypothetical protein
MPATSRPALIVLVLATLLVAVTGCTTTVPGMASPAGSMPATTADPVKWVDGVCGALLPFVQTAGTPPQLGSAADPAGLARGISDYLGQSARAADSAIGGMTRVGPSPVAGGDDVVTRLAQTLTTFKTSFQNVKAQVDAVDISDRKAVVAELPKAVAPLQDLANLPDPTVDLQASPELDQASQHAPNCQQVRRQTSGR